MDGTTISIPIEQLCADDRSYVFDRLPDQIKKYIEESNKQRKKHIETVENNLKKTEAYLKKAQKALVDSSKSSIVLDTKRITYPSKESKAWDIKNKNEILKKEQELLKRHKDVSTPFMAEMSQDKKPEIEMIGRCGFQIFVQQVIDKNNMLVDVVWWSYSSVIREGRYLGEKPISNKTLVWIRDYPTKGIVDDQKISLEGVFCFSDTKTYQTAQGSKTVLVMSPIDMTGYEVFFKGGKEK